MNLTRHQQKTLYCIWLHALSRADWRGRRDGRLELEQAITASASLRLFGMWRRGILPCHRTHISVGGCMAVLFIRRPRGPFVTSSGIFFAPGSCLKAFDIILHGRPKGRLRGGTIADLAESAMAPVVVMRCHRSMIRISFFPRPSIVAQGITRSASSASTWVTKQSKNAEYCGVVVAP